jgi:hypothetical protein
MKCPNCNGKFTNPEESVLWCNFCHGKKDLDWIENIFGVTPGFHSFSFDLDLSNSFGISTMNEIAEKMAKEIALEIDKDIMLRMYKGEIL